VLSHQRLVLPRRVADIATAQAEDGNDIFGKRDRRHIRCAEDHSCARNPHPVEDWLDMRAEIVGRGP